MFYIIVLPKCSKIVQIVTNVSISMPQPLARQPTYNYSRFANCSVVDLTINVSLITAKVHEEKFYKISS